MPYLFSDAELDDFLDSYVDCVADGHMSGVFVRETLAKILDKRALFEHELLMVLRFNVDPDLDRFTSVSPSRGKFYTVPGTHNKEKYLREVLEEKLRLRLIALREIAEAMPESLEYQRTFEEEWEYEAAQTGEIDLAQRERRFVQEDRIKQRFEDLFSPIEIEDKRIRAEEERAKNGAAAIERDRQRSALMERPAPAPEPQPYGVSPRGAEMLVAVWMRHLGFTDAVVTPEKSDGGIDVTSGTHVAQVKHYTGNVSVVEVRELFGVAIARDKAGLFFTSNGYTADAITFAASVNLPLFLYSAEDGTLRGANSWARALL